MTEADIVSNAFEKSKKIFDNSSTSSIMKAILKQQVDPQAKSVPLGDQVDRVVQPTPQQPKRPS